MERAGPCSVVWRRGIAMSEVMTRSILILRSLGPPMQILPQQQARHFSSASTSCLPTLPSLFQSCRQVRQHSSHTIRHEGQRVLLLDNKLQSGRFRVRHFPSSFHGDARALKLERPWPKEKFKDVFNLYLTGKPKKTAHVQSVNRSSDESHRPPGNYPSLVTQLPTALEPRFPSANVDQTKTWDLNAPGNFDQSCLSSTLEVVQPGSKARSMAVPTVRTISEHTCSRRAEKSNSDQRAPNPNNGRPGPRFATSFMLGRDTLPRSSNRIASSNLNPNSSKQIEVGVESKIVISNQPVRRTPDGGTHLQFTSHATQKSYGKSGTRVEPAYVVVDQARSSQNGAHPALNTCWIPVGSVITQTPGVAKLYTPSLQRVPQEMDAFRDQWRLQDMAAELYRREAQSAQPKYRLEAEAFPGFQGARRHGNDVAQLEAPHPPTRAGAAKGREAAKMIEQKHNPSHKVVGGIESRQHNTDSLRVKLERVGDINASLTRSTTANDVLEIREREPLPREEEQQSSAISERGVTENSMRQGLATDHLLEIREAEPVSREEEGPSSAISGKGVTENSVRQDLRTEQLLSKALWMDGPATPAWMKAGLNLIPKDRMQSRASHGSRDCSRNTAHGNGSTHMHSAGTTSEAIAVLQNRLQLGISTDSHTYVKVLQMCLKQKDLLAAKQVHDCIMESGMDKNPYVASSLLNVYIRCGGLLDARRVFDELEKKSVITWNMMIAGYAKSDDTESALKLFRLMRQDGARPTEVTYLCILKACASPLALTWGRQVHDFIRHAGFESDVRVGTALLQMYAKCGCITEARRVFENLANRNIVTWTIMIGACADHGHGVEAYQLFLEMRREGFKPNAVTYVSILNASASAGALEWVKDVHAHASKAGLGSDLRVGNSLIRMYAKIGSIDDARQVFDIMEKRDVFTWNIMIGGLAQHGCGDEAYRLFHQMRREGLEPDAITYLSILNACASAGALEWLKQVHGHARQAGLESDVRVGNALVHMYAKSGSLDDARLVFDRIENRDVVTWNIMIGGLAQHGCGHEALELFRKMNEDLLKPNRTTLSAVLSACCHRGLLDDGRRLFLAMTQHHGIEPDIVHYTCMVDLLGRAGHLEEAKLFIRDMPVEPDAVIWIALLGACRTYGNVELGELAAREVFKLEPNHAAGYVTLSNIYAAAGKWEKVSLVRTTMQERGVRKEPGRSWIEVDNKIHEFIVGDTSHPEAKAIKSYLNKLTETLKAEGYIPETQLVLQNVDEEDKELALCSHSEKLAIAYGLMCIPGEKPIRVYKNLRVCSDCHTATKLISKVTRREIIARDANRFHHFKDGMCSCGDYW